MEKREIVKLAMEGQKVPYVPWACGFTIEAADKLVDYYGDRDLDKVIDNHLIWLGNQIGFFENLGNDRFRDVFGVVWNRSIDKDIGDVEVCVLPEPTLEGYEFPDPLSKCFFEDIPDKLSKYGDRFRAFGIGWRGGYHSG